MRERPILFSDEMVLAILQGLKTQTRRVVKPQPNLEWLALPITVGWYAPTIVDWDGREDAGPEIFGAYDRDGWGMVCPYGAPGDRLWVREAFGCNCHNSAQPVPGCEIVYRATGDSVDDPPFSAWRPSIHMPRWASRMALEITGVRVERVQDIGEADARAEGITGVLDSAFPSYHVVGERRPKCHSAVEAFGLLWDSINGKRGYGWAANPWVWVIEFTRSNSR